MQEDDRQASLANDAFVNIRPSIAQTLPFRTATLSDLCYIQAHG